MFLHLSKNQGLSREQVKGRDPRQGIFTYGGLSGALNGVGVQTGVGAGGKPQNSAAPGHGPGQGGELGLGPSGFWALEAP